MYTPETKELRFNENGKFRILMISDFHVQRAKDAETGRRYSPKLKAGIEALVAETNPDFVMLGGDQCVGFDPETMRASMEDIMEPVQKRGIPWAHVNGNHDNESPMNKLEQEAVYESFPLCLSQAGPEDVKGVGNYVLPIYASKGDRVAYNLFAMDSQRHLSDQLEEFGVSKEDNNALLPFCFGSRSVQAMPYFHQVMWYYQTSQALEKQNGSKTPALMFLHNPIIEYNLIYRNPEQCDMEGSKREMVCCSELNSGLFFACLERGDVKGIFCGHEHMNTYQGKYCGITLAYDGCVGYDMSAHDDLRGGRIIDLDEATGAFETRHLTLMNLMGKAAMRDPTWLEGGVKYSIRQTHLQDGIW